MKPVVCSMSPGEILKFQMWQTDETQNRDGCVLQVLHARKTNTALKNHLNIGMVQLFFKDEIILQTAIILRMK